jgi:hypothetical protein
VWIVSWEGSVQEGFVAMPNISITNWLETRKKAMARQDPNYHTRIQTRGSASKHDNAIAEITCADHP